MAQFIKLTDKTGVITYVNPNLVEAFFRDEARKLTFINFAGDTQVAFKETPEQILDLLKGKES